MMGKIIKHELRASVLLYGVVGGISLFFALATMINRAGNDDFSYLRSAPFLVMGCTIAILVLILLFLIHTALRYRKSMYGNEGYLTFTLPVHSWELVLGKFAASAIWGILVCLLCGVLCFSILYSSVQPSATEAFWNELGNLWAKPEFRQAMLVFCGTMLISTFEQIAILFLSVTLAQMPCFRRANGILALVFYFVITFAEGKITNLIPALSQKQLDLSLTPLFEMGDIAGFTNGMSVFLGTAILASVIFSVIYLVVNIILVKKCTSLQ